MTQTDKQNSLPYLKDVCARVQSNGSALMNWIDWTIRLNMVLMNWGMCLNMLIVLVGLLRSRLIELFKSMFSVFKQYYTYFYTFFHSHVFLNNTNNITKQPLMSMPMLLRRWQSNYGKILLFWTLLY